MIRDALDEQIEAYFGLLPDIRRKHGSVWALVAHRALVETFPDFSSAAHYVEEHLPDTQVLIRHTDEARENVPYVHIGE